MESKEERRDMVKRMICDKKREEKRRKEKKREEKRRKEKKREEKYTGGVNAVCSK